VNTSLAVAVIASLLLKLRSLHILSHRRKRITSSSFKTTLFAGGRPRFLPIAVHAADAGAGELTNAGLASSDIRWNGRNIHSFINNENQFII